MITGCAGMVGSHCVQYYSRRAEKVFGIDSLIRSRLFKSEKKSVEYNWEYLSKFKNVNRIYLDIRERDDLEEVFKKNSFDLIIHAAAQPGVSLSLASPEDDFSINAAGTFNLLELARRYSPSAVFIYCSTNKVYGDNLSKYELIEEESRYSFKNITGIPEDLGVDLTSHTPYGVSKYVGDIYVQEYAAVYGLKAAVFRMSCIYGIRQFGFQDQGWLAWFLIAALTGKSVNIYGNGKQVRDALFIDDLVEAFDAFYNSGISAAVYNIGGGIENTISILEYLNMLEDKLGLKIERSYQDWRLSDQKVYISDISKVSAALNWHPRTSISKGIDAVISWVRSNKNMF
ncbi:MAG TPA: NAD-dependent epimerase/dehydratase family protein [Candidatus Omnitrophica bacterium]|nr:NAD-dependent epimerase/dehydratase family protein [Candidatus Omnitrophota bacterium]